MPDAAPALDHVAILVRDLAAARAHWTEVVGLPVAREPDLSGLGLDGVFLGTGRGQIELYTILDAEVLDAALGGADARMDHIALVAPDLEGTAAALTGDGASLRHPGTLQPTEEPIDAGGTRHVWSDGADAGRVPLQVTAA